MVTAKINLDGGTQAVQRRQKALGHLGALTGFGETQGYEQVSPGLKVHGAEALSL